MTTYDRQRNEYRKILNCLTPKEWEIEVSPERTVRAIICHMVGWEKEAVIQLRKPRNESYSMGIKDYQEFNPLTVKKYKKLTNQELISEWEKWQKLLDKEIKKADKKTLEAKSQLFDWIIDGKVNNHYECHLLQLRKLFL